jgi:hypothetical protein
VAVTWVAGTTLSHTTATSISAAVPGTISPGDLLVAAVFARSAITAPSGWTQVRQVEWDNNGAGISQRLAVYRKDTVVAGDVGASFTWEQVDNARMGVVYAAVRDHDGIAEHAGATVADSTPFDDPPITFLVTPPALTGSAAGQMLLVFASTIYATSGSVTPSPQASFTLFSGSSLSAYRLAGARRAIGTGESNSGTFDMAPGAADADFNGLGAITLRIAAGAAPTPAVTGRIDAPGPLGAPMLAGRAIVGGRISAPGPLGPPRGIVMHDFTGRLAGDSGLYVMDVYAAGGERTRVPISSWQGTLRSGSPSFLQAVVPAVGPYTAALAAAVEFRISRVGALAAGGSEEFEMARAPLDTLQLATGPTNTTATLQGYGGAFPALGEASPVTRTLRQVRAVFTATGSGGSRRVRCAIDWLLRPGMQFRVPGLVEPSFTGFVNYYVTISDSGQAAADQWMDVGNATDG